VGAEVLRTLDAAGVPIAGLALREPSLDDVFLSLTGHKSEVETAGEAAAGSKRARRARQRGPESDADGSDADGRDAA
jgi:ABC-2 type transport system ATP-binding protein